ncbi:hypothetical protein KP509_14G031700 [Ceratopteris richardii]|uniref:Uncharacterized protein n=1 Tax=Ceratopteris richardii TaxID=49495 RepID=A0A8T2T8B4_CERRI|nr:hypothetical protein KP509_14G031700 [Ceratopteris richardii]
MSSTRRRLSMCAKPLTFEDACELSILSAIDEFQESLINRHLRRRLSSGSLDILLTTTRSVISSASTSMAHGVSLSSRGGALLLHRVVLPLYMMMKLPLQTDIAFASRILCHKLCTFSWK